MSLTARRCINKLVALNPDERIGSVSEAAAMLSHQVRTSMQDWRWDGENALLIAGGKQIEICPTKSGQYEAFQVKEGTPRRVRGVRPGNLHQVLRQIE